ncbi:MAG: hypothetical protein MHM6MM_001730 [Cercozoa sp. M6MM]
MNALRLVSRRQLGARFLAAEVLQKEFITIQRVGEKEDVSLITLNRPKALNALCDGLMREVTEQLFENDENEEIGATVITGSEKAFAAGADIKEMAPQTYMTAYKKDMLSHWDQVAQARKPVIAAVNGFALGGGCELAMMCDIILVGDRAKFGQPEIKLGTIPGVGGTQRLTRAIGKARAMELILTGDFMDADEAVSRGLAARKLPADKLVDEAVSQASKIASFSQPVVGMAKECVNVAFESSLREGVRFERRVFHSTFATKDQKEGMSAFAEKRPAEFQNE